MGKKGFYPPRYARGPFRKVLNVLVGACLFLAVLMPFIIAYVIWGEDGIWWVVMGILAACILYLVGFLFYMIGDLILG